MNHLIVYAHPRSDSFNHAILDTAVHALKSKGHEVTVRDLYQIGFNPLLTAQDTAAIREGRTPTDILTEQEFITRADVITFIYPIWWTGLPAIIKGYVDRVFAYGFAYQYNKDGGLDKLLSGKKGVIVHTYGTPEEIYKSIGMTGSLKQTSQGGIFEFVGIETLELLQFGGVTSVADETRKDMLQQVADKFSSL